MKNIFIVGSLNMDLVINAPFVPDNGVTITGKDFMMNPGGKGANQAAAIGKLGGICHMIGCVGQDFGENLIKILNSYNVNTEFVQLKQNVSSGIAVIIVVDGDNRIILDKGANAFLDCELIDNALNIGKEGDFLVAQLEIENDIVKYALLKAKQKGMITILNPAPAKKLDDEIFSCCDYFIPNQSETEFYTGIYPDDETSALSAINKLQALGVSNIIITMGGKGVVYEEKGKIINVPAFKVNAIDTTAAGDTFVGAFVSELSNNKSIGDAILFANQAAAITVTRKGAQQSIPTRMEVVKKYQKE